MIKVLLFDLSNTILFSKDKNYVGGLNRRHLELLTQNPDYDFYQYFELDNDLLDFLKTLKNKYQIALYTSELIQNTQAIKSKLEEVFNPIFSALEIGYKKDSPESYIYIAKQLGVMPNEILFIDDSQKNIDAAKSAHTDAWLYQNFKQLRQSIQKILNSKN